MGTGLSHGCAHFEERKDGDGRCVIFVFLDARRRLFTLTLRPRTFTVYGSISATLNECTVNECTERSMYDVEYIVDLGDVQMCYIKVA